MRLVLRAFTLFLLWSSASFKANFAALNPFRKVKAHQTPLADILDSDCVNFTIAIKAKNLFPSTRGSRAGQVKPSRPNQCRSFDRHHT